MREERHEANSYLPAIIPITANLKDKGVSYKDLDFDKLVKQYSGIEPAPYQILIRIWIGEPYKEQVSAGGVILTDGYLEEQQKDKRLMNLTGIVVKLGRDAYKDEKLFPSGPWCKVGNWVQFPRASGHSFIYRNMSSLYMRDDSILGVIDSPNDVERIL